MALQSKLDHRFHNALFITSHQIKGFLGIIKPKMVSHQRINIYSLTINHVQARLYTITLPSNVYDQRLFVPDIINAK